jgi:hypothetical protein
MTVALSESLSGWLSFHGSRYAVFRDFWAFLSCNFDQLAIDSLGMSVSFSVRSRSVLVWSIAAQQAWYLLPALMSCTVVGINETGSYLGYWSDSV